MEKPKRKKNQALLVILGMLAILLLFLLALFALYSINRSARAKKDFNSRPLVLIHAPLNHESVEVGEIVTVHATARQDNVGLSAVELWVDDIRVAERLAPEGETPGSMLLSETWIPTLSGRHVVIVRATAINGVQGQATVIVEAGQEAASATDTYQVEEGDTLASIAEEIGTTPEELAGLNPDLGGGEPAPGDELDLPGLDSSEEEAGGERTEDGEPEPGGDEPGGGEDDDTAPDPEDSAPGDSESFPDMGGDTAVFPDMGGDDIGFTGEPVGLRVEVLQMGELVPGLESLYCYVHLGLQSTVRYPDTDMDPSTDESFTQLGDDTWSGEPYLVGSSAPVVYWPDEEDLPFETTCTGVTGGGTDALDMGTFDINIPPEHWDGTQRSQWATGSDGSYFVDYRVSRVTDLRDVPLYQDPDMTAPTNVAVNQTTHTLLWNYAPRPEEEPISGFHIYLNGTLQWVEGAGINRSELPPEWLNPPCGETYTFGVTAYRFDLPDGPESPPGEASITAPEEGEGCQRQIEINFVTLQTFDLGGDGGHEPRDGDVGPPYGDFYANGQLVHFDPRGWIGPLIGSLDSYMSLNHNTTYNLAEMAANPDWGFGRQPSVVVHPPSSGSLDLGFRISDFDDGECSYSGDPDCDDPICDGEVSVDGALDLHHEGTIIADNNRCRVTYNYGPAPGSPAGGGAAGEVPLPWIEVEGISVYEPTGLLTVRVHNGGSAAWAGQDLEVALEYRDGTPIGMETWEALELGAGERQGLGTSDIILEPPYDVCVTVDPNDLVTEYYEASGTRTHTRFCPNLPDLWVKDIQYRAGESESLLVTIGNIGDTSLENRSLTMEGFMLDGSSASILNTWPNVTIRPYEERTFVFAGISEAVHARMAGGYRMVVDPNNTIAELNEENNSREVNPSRLKIWWCDTRIPVYRVLRVATAEMTLYVQKNRGSGVEDVHIGTRTDESSNHNCWDAGCNNSFFCSYTFPAFTILEDEDLAISIHAKQDYSTEHDDLGTPYRVFTPGEDWGSFPAADENDWNHAVWCKNFSYTPRVDRVVGEDPWFTYICILEMPD